jgi:polyphenol oxidase
MLPVLHSPNLVPFRHAFFMRQGGVSEGLYGSLNGGQGSKDDPVAVLENRRRMANHLGVEATYLVSLDQIHSADVVVVTDPWTRETRPKGDAMVTNRKGIALGITTADCGPILFGDPQAGVIGAAHAGWKGALAGVIEATVSAMESLGASRQRLFAALGPTIHMQAYEVGADFRATFLEKAETHAVFFREDSHGKLFFNLPAFIAHHIKASGIVAFHDLACCTLREDAHFFSFRRATLRGEADYGRMISAIVL